MPSKKTTLFLKTDTPYVIMAKKNLSSKKKSPSTEDAPKRTIKNLTAANCGPTKPILKGKRVVATKKNAGSAGERSKPKAKPKPGTDTTIYIGRNKEED